MIDVIILTKNSGRLLNKCLNSIIHNIPINRIIAIDGGSTDTTKEILKDYGVLIIDDNQGTRATARQKGIDEVETEWFAFVDSDVILGLNWFYHIKKFMQNDVGGIYGYEILAYITNNILRRLQVLSNIHHSARRGGNLTMAGLIKTEAVKDIEIPPEFHIFEDEYILNHIKSKGYRIIFSANSYCYHYRSPKAWDLNKLIRDKILELKFGRFKVMNQIPELIHGLISKLVLFSKGECSYG